MPKPGAMPKPRDSGARACRRQLLYAAASRAASETVNEGHARAYSLGTAPHGSHASTGADHQVDE
ncbi:MAG: hypothetical protein GX547_01845 [Phycisphaerae bacterium]|nr:hypothetical protein [Phycisphaerae bacterium]